MATLAQNLPPQTRRLAWLREFLTEELAPYPGRTALVTRMVVAATVVMIITMTFRIPYGAYATLYALTISRESPEATVKAVKTIIIAFVLAAVEVLMGAVFFASDPMLRLLWIIGTLFITFFCLSAMTNYTAAARFGYLVIITIPLWDRHIREELKVENTLWAVCAITIASVITAVFELIFAALRPGDDLIRALTERLAAVEEVLSSDIAGHTRDELAEKKITRLGMTGTSRLRRLLERSTYPARYREQLGAVVALTGRLVDIAANLAYLRTEVPDEHRERTRSLAEAIANIRTDLLNGRTPTPVHFPSAGDLVHSSPLLREMETTVSLISEVFVGSQLLSAYAPSPSGDPPTTFFVPDAFSNREHVQFGLKGCLAASLCYIIYSSLAWPEISTSVTTCLLTALTTIGASRQKQVLRFAGALAGGVVFGIGAQVFILPYLDSIAGFTVLFLAATIVMAWFGTSSTRFSYFGVQLAVAFYLINLQEFKFQTSLVVARDRVAGVLLGLFMMWLVFDQLWSAPAAAEMKRTFITTLRLLAQFAREPVSKDLRVAIERSYSLRETINKNFDKVRAMADGVLFEFGPTRRQDLALRDQIRRWQPQVRVLFITRIGLLKYRLKLPGFELPQSIASAQQEFDEELARTLDAMADRLEAKPAARDRRLEDAFKSLKQSIESHGPEESKQALGGLSSFVLLSRRIESLTAALNEEI